MIDFTIERQRHRRFVGREDVLAQLDEWLVGPGEAGWVVVTGGPGMGKSAVLSAWLGRREAAGAVVPHHFVRRQVVDWDQPERIVASLAGQIEAMFPEVADPAARPEARLIELLGRVSKRLGAAGELVVLVDGLDETRAEPGENPLPRFLPHVVPVGVRLLCALRPSYPHLGWIDERSPVRRIDLDDKRWAASNEAVVRGFWEAVAGEYKPALPEETVRAAIEHADGNVLHAVMLHDALRGLPAAERRADRVPRGLRGLIGEIWREVAADESVRVGLGLLCAAHEALSLDVLGELAGWSYEERERFVPSARQLLLEEPASWAGVEAYRPRHDWVRELMVERLGAATLRAHHETLAKKLASWPAAGEAAARRYALRHALIHRVEAGAWAEAWALASDMGFVEAKCRELGAHDAEADLVRAAERCRASGDEGLRDRFDDLARALSRESHWLREAPEAAGALVWNRLRQSGWSEARLAQQLKLTGAAFLRVRHLSTRESPALMRDLIGHAGVVLACAVTPDGRRVVSASYDRTLRVWDLASGRALATLEGHAALVTACAVTPDGRRVISASYDQTLKVWDLETGRALATLEGHAFCVTACVVTPDGRHVISGSEDNTLRVWDLETGRALATLEGHALGVAACAVTPDGRHVISGSEDNTLRVWDLETGRALATLEGHTSVVTACAVTPDGRRVISASHDRTLKVWDLETGSALATLEGHTSSVTACAVTPDGRCVVSGSFDRTLKVWDLRTGHMLATLEGHSLWVRACVVTPDGRHVVSAAYDETIKVWDLGTGRALAAPAGRIEFVTACAVTPDGRRAVSASSAGMLEVWDPETGRALATLEGHTAWVSGCAVTPDGRVAISASTDRTVKVWDLETGQVRTTLEGHAFGVSACAVTPDGRRVVSVSEDRTLKVWDPETGRALVTLTGQASSGSTCVVTPDGRRIVWAADGKTLEVWELETGRALGALEGHAAWMRACAVSHDGRRIVWASVDHTIRVWDSETGRVLTTLSGHTHSVTACAVTPDGRRVVSASDDRTVKVWDLASGACLFTHRANVGLTAVAATEHAIVAGDVAGAVWFLAWPPAELPGPSIGGGPGSGAPLSPALPPASAPRKHTILFLAANPGGTDRLALDREAHAIQVELERSGFRDRFELVTRWAAEPLDLLRELRRLKPTVVHFSGHGSSGGSAPDASTPEPRRDALGLGGGESRPGLYFHSAAGGAQLVSTEALEKAFGAAGSSVKLVVLNACYSEVQARALLAHVGCVVGMSRSIRDDVARTFSIGFYGGLGDREPVAAAYQQGCAAIELEGLPEGDRPQLAVRAGVDASTLVLAADPP